MQSNKMALGGASWVAAILIVAVSCQKQGSRCSLCTSLFGFEHLDCGPQDAPPGCRGDLVTCPCKYDCRDITLQCHSSGSWLHLGSNGPTCGPNHSYLNQSFGDHRFASYFHESGLYKFSCTPGYQLVGTSDVTCTNNVLSRPFPECRRESAPGQLTATTTTKTSTVDASSLKQHSINESEVLKPQASVISNEKLYIMEEKIAKEISEITIVIIVISTIFVLCAIAVFVYMILRCVKNKSNMKK